MKSIRYAASAALLIVCSCGEGPVEPVSATAVMPEEPLVAMAVADPGAVISNIDGYIAGGIPMLGENFLSTTLSAAAGVDDLESLLTGWGFDPHGTAVFFMEAMTPATMGFAVSATDPDQFFTSMEEMGVTFTEGESIDGVTVQKAEYPGGYLYVADSRGLLLAAGSTATLTSMLGRIDPDGGTAGTTLEPASLYFRMELGSIGPMAAAQLEMVRPQILSEMAETGGPGDEMGMRMIGIYFDAISLFLTQTSTVESRIVIGPEEISCESYADFVAGSELATVLTAPVEVHDLTGFVPEGDVIMARVSVPPELTIAVVNAMTGALGMSYPEEALATYAEWSRNTAMSVMSDDAGTFFHLVAAYELPEGTGLEDVRAVYQSQVDFAQTMLEGTDGMMEMSIVDESYMDRDFVMFEMAMNPGAMDMEGSGIPEGSFPEMNFTTWLTVSDGLLWMEMAAEPLVVTQILDGTWTGVSVLDSPVFPVAPDAQMVIAFNFDAYFRMLAGFMGDQVDLSALPENPVWITGWMESSPADSRLTQHYTLSGMDLAAMIGNYIPIFAGGM